MQYLNKRDKNGLLLSYTALRLANDISFYCFEKTQKTEIYKILKLFFNNEYLEVYFKKLYYLEAQSLCHKITINDWNKDNNSNHDLNTINIKTFPVEKYLADFLLLKKIKFKNNLNIHAVKIKFSKFIYNIKNILKKKIFLFFKKNEEIKNIGEKIATCYGEGINLDKRSDLFWLEDSKINPSDVILYFEDKAMMNKYEKEKDLFIKIKQLQIRTIKLWEQDYTSEVDFINEIIIKLKELNISNSEEKALHKISLQLINNIKFWYLFFKKLNIKIHLDVKEYSTDTVVKQLALCKLDGCSVGKLRSYPGVESYDFLGYYPNDIFFVPSEDAAKRMKNNSFNKFQYIIIGGSAYNSITSNNKVELEEIKKFFNDNNKKFIILLLDSNFSENKSSSRFQFLSTESFLSFYNIFVDTLSKVDDIGIIIKTKKLSLLKHHKDLYLKILDLEKKGICYLVKDPFQKKPSLYASIANLVVATGSKYPSSLMECVGKKKLGIFCDFANLKSIEQELYNWGEKKVIFNNMKELSNKILEFKNDRLKNKYFGDWSHQKEILDPYQDNMGGKRIGQYIKILLDNFKNKLSSFETITKANNEFSKMWGKDKIIKL